MAALGWHLYSIPAERLVLAPRGQLGLLPRGSSHGHSTPESAGNPKAEPTQLLEENAILDEQHDQRCDTFSREDVPSPWVQEAVSCSSRRAHQGSSGLAGG